MRIALHEKRRSALCCVAAGVLLATIVGWNLCTAPVRVLHESGVEPLRVVVVQVDDRADVDWVKENLRLNQEACRRFGFEYVFFDQLVAKELTYEALNNLSAHFAKLDAIRRVLKLVKGDTCVVMLDGGDAWIVDGRGVIAVCLLLLQDPQTWGAFSRDPYEKRNTYVNSGSFVMRAGAPAELFFERVAKDVVRFPGHHDKWPFEQHYVSRAVFDERSHFLIFTPEVLNTPNGTILAHQWWKSSESLRSQWRAVRKRQWAHPDDTIVHRALRSFDHEPFPNVAE